MANHFVGQITLFPFNFAPVGWALCQGQLLPITQYTALFSLLGTQFGGDGRSNFALPDLRGRAPIGQGQGPGLSVYDIGSAQGVEAVTLTTTTTPPHSHGFPAFATTATTNAPSGALPAEGTRHAGEARFRSTLTPLPRTAVTPGGWSGCSGTGGGVAPQQPAAVSDAELVHCAAGNLPTSHLVQSNLGAMAHRRRTRTMARAIPWSDRSLCLQFCAEGVGALRRTDPADQSEPGAVLAAGHHLWRRRDDNVSAAGPARAHSERALARGRVSQLQPRASGRRRRRTP